MAYETGTATDPTDFLAKLETFLTTNADLVAAGEEWTVAWTSPTDPNEKVFRGTGLAGLDTIYVGVRLFTDVPLDQAYVEFVGMTDILNAATDLHGHVNACPHSVRLFLDFSTFTYHFIANGRRFMIANKISTVYQSGYFGYMLPYVTPDRYPEPLVISAMSPGSSTDFNLNTYIAESWRDATDGHSAITQSRPGRTSSNSADRFSGTLVLTPDYNWKSVYYNSVDASWLNVSPTSNFILPDFYQIDGTGRNVLYPRISEAYGGDQWLMPLIILDGFNQQTLGELQGYSYVTGIRQTADTLIDVSGTDHLVVQNAFRTDKNDYLSVELA